MASSRSRVNLDDVDAMFFCLTCGATYQLERQDCASCLAEFLTSREEIVQELLRSCPDREPSDLTSQPLVPFTEPLEPDRLLEIRETLRRNGTPYVLIRADGSAVEPSAEGKVTILVPQNELRLPDLHSVRLTTASTPYEADLIQARLDDAEIPYQINQMSSQFLFTSGALSGVTIHVSESDLDRARRAIEIDEPFADESSEDAAMRVARVDRICMIARLFLYLTGAVYVFVSLLFATSHVLDTTANVVMGGVLIGLAYHSHKAPRQAFLWSFLVLVAASLWGMLANQPYVLVPGILCLLAVYFAYQTAGKNPE